MSLTVACFYSLVSMNEPGNKCTIPWNNNRSIWTLSIYGCSQKFLRCRCVMRLLIGGNLDIYRCSHNSHRCSSVMWLLIGGTHSPYNNRLGASVGCTAQSLYKRRSSVWALCNTRLSGKFEYVDGWADTSDHAGYFVHSDESSTKFERRTILCVGERNLGFNLYNAWRGSGLYHRIKKARNDRSFWLRISYSGSLFSSTSMKTKIHEGLWRGYCRK